MHNGTYCRYIRNRDGSIASPNLGTMTTEEYVTHMLFDAASPEQIDDLAAQCLDMGRRCKTRGAKEWAALWKESWKLCKAEADAARSRLSSYPTEESHPSYFMKRTIGAIGLLYGDVRLPLFFRFHLKHEKASVGIYETPIKTNTVYTVSGFRDGAAWIEPIGQEGIPSYKRSVSKVPGAMLKGLLALGRIEALNPAQYIGKCAEDGQMSSVSV